MLQLKTGVDLLPKQYAQEFKHLSSLLYQKQSENAITIVAERNELLGKIRALPGLNHFLLPKEYIELRQAAQNGPILILNSHKTRCDAVAILNPTSDPLHIPLPDVTVEQLELHKTLLKDALKRCNSRS
jgi:hypothetical protein